LAGRGARPFAGRGWFALKSGSNTREDVAAGQADIGQLAIRQGAQVLIGPAALRPGAHRLGGEIRPRPMAEKSLRTPAAMASSRARMAAKRMASSSVSRVMRGGGGVGEQANLFLGDAGVHDDLCCGARRGMFCPWPRFAGAT
jgi:hypothetical protein